MIEWECHESLIAACNMSEEEGSGVVEEEYDETGTRNIWAILTWTVVGITIILNLSLIFILVTRRNLKSIANKREQSQQCPYQF